MQRPLISISWIHVHRNLIKLQAVGQIRPAAQRWREKKGARGKVLTGVRKDSATNRALALSCKEGDYMLVHIQYPVYGRAVYTTYEELHLGNLLVNLLLELNDKVDKLVLQHLFGVEVCYQEGNVVALC